MEDNEDKVYPAEEQGIEEDESTEEIAQDMQTGEKEADVYTEEGREQQVEEGEITPSEEGFMEGEETDHGNCVGCGNVLGDDKDKIVEKEIHGNMLWFCSDKCLKDFDRKEEKTEIIFGEEVASEESEEESGREKEIPEEESGEEE